MQHVLDQRTAATDSARSRIGRPDLGLRNMRNGDVARGTSGVQRGDGVVRCGVEAVRQQFGATAFVVVVFFGFRFEWRWPSSRGRQGG